MDAAQWPQGIGVVRAVECSRNSEKKPRPPKEQALNCPRCKSTNTKFCYYNNYSLSQPRYFCKSCRRYWTEGGTLRNVPVGGSSRKNKRSSSSSSSSSQKSIPDLSPPKFSPQNPKIHDGRDLNDLPLYNGLVALPFTLQQHNPNPQNPNSLSSLIHAPSPGFSVENRFMNRQPAVQDDPTASRILFPFEEPRAVANYDFDEQRRDSNGFWSGMLYEGSW